MKKRILVLGAGFGGLELSTMLSETFGDGIEVTLIDKSDSFYFGFSKLDVMFAHARPNAVRLPYKKFVKPGVRLLQETISLVDPIAKRVTTDRGTHEADFLVVALGADYDFAATPGMADATEFYTLAGATRLGEILPSFTKGRVLIAVGGAPFKCPPAPSEAALMMHDYLSTRGVRSACEITLILPLEAPTPPSPETSRALLAAFAERRRADRPCGRGLLLQSGWSDGHLSRAFGRHARRQGAIRFESPRPLVWTVAMNWLKAVRPPTGTDRRTRAEGCARRSGSS